jgi:hypothetical protein
MPIAVKMLSIQVHGGHGNAMGKMRGQVQVGVQLKSQRVVNLRSQQVGTTAQMRVLYSKATACDNSCLAGYCSGGIQRTEVAKARAEEAAAKEAHFLKQCAVCNNKVGIHKSSVASLI